MTLMNNTPRPMIFRLDRPGARTQDDAYRTPPIHPVWINGARQEYRALRKKGAGRYEARREAAYNVFLGSLS